MAWLAITGIRILLIAGLMCCMYYATRQGVAAWYVRQGSATGAESALRWEPDNAQTWDAYGTLVHMYADGSDTGRILHDYEKATELSPRNARYWEDLAAAYEWAGRPTQALAAFQRAQELFPNSAEINWRIANFYARQGASNDALLSLRKVLVTGGISRNDIFRLASASTEDAHAILTTISVDGSALPEYLNFCVVNDDMRTAEQVWRYLLEQKSPFALSDAFPYLDSLIRHRDLTRLQDDWTLLSRRFPEIPIKRDSNMVVNGSFDRDLLNGGLDWRVTAVAGAEVRTDPQHGLQGGRALRIDFDGTQNFYYRHVYQYVPVHPNTRYRFSGYLRVNGITTESGPTFEIYDAYDMKKLFVSGNGLTGTSDWVRQELAVTTAKDTDLLVIRVARHPSHRIANQLGGTVWVDEVRLEPAR